MSPRKRYKRRVAPTDAPSAHTQITIARQHEKEIHRQITVIKPLIDRTRGKPLKKMIPDNHQRSHTAQPVEHLKVRLTVCIGSTRNSFVDHK